MPIDLSQVPLLSVFKAATDDEEEQDNVAGASGKKNLSRILKLTWKSGGPGAGSCLTRLGSGAKITTMLGYGANVTLHR